MTSLEPSKRSWTERTGPVRRDVDQAARARMLKSVAWGAVPGAFFGIVVGAGIGGVLGVLAGLALFVGLSGFGFWVSEAAGRAGNTFLHPSARLAKAPANSRADALEARGDFQEAVDAWEVTASEFPDHPEPAARVARLYRDHLNDPDAAFRWLKRAVERAEFGPEARVPMREIVGVAKKLDPTGRAAAPLLARYAEVAEAASEGEWARGELAWIKERMAELSPPSSSSPS